MITHTHTNKHVRILSENGGGKFVVQELEAPDSLHIVSLDQLKADGGVKEFHTVLSKLTERENRKNAYKPSHGLDIHAIRALGHHVHVTHYRLVNLNLQRGYTGFYSRNKLEMDQTPSPLFSNQAEMHFILMPLTVNSHGKVFNFFERGGYTRVEIVTKDNSHRFVVASQCSVKDSFCYKLGVKTALDRLTFHQQAILTGTPLVNTPVPAPSPKNFALKTQGTPVANQQDNTTITVG